tara:strand:- start:10664 stop:11140 length:477 start_codon:yes stop_codon:yes gene_type:complete
MTIVHGCTAERGSDALAHFLVAHSAVLIMRALCVGATLMPTPVLLYRDPGSVPDSKSVRLYMVRNFDVSFQLILLQKYILTANDLMFSGHTALYIILAGVWSRYLVPSSCVPLVWLVAVLSSFSLVFTRQHYTVDVIVALLLVWHVFYAKWVIDIVNW